MADMTHVVFRDAETGRFAFHAMWPTAKVRAVEMAAGFLGLTFDEFVHKAIQDYVANHPALSVEAMSLSAEHPYETVSLFRR